MDYKYENEKESKETIIIYMFCIIISISTIISNTSILIEKMKQPSKDSYIWIVWFASIFGIILLDIFLVHFAKLSETERKNFIKWKNYLTSNGIKINGVVKEIRYITQNNYKFRIGYFSELNKNDIEYETSIINIPKLDYNKKILCDVYESREYKPVVDYDAEAIRISGNKIELTFNPFKLYKIIAKKYRRDWFGNAVAVNFHYEKE